MTTTKKVVLVTGCTTGGIGYETAKAFEKVIQNCRVTDCSFAKCSLHKERYTHPTHIYTLWVLDHSADARSLLLPEDWMLSLALKVSMRMLTSAKQLFIQRACGIPVTNSLCRLV